MAVVREKSCGALVVAIGPAKLRKGASRDPADLTSDLDKVDGTLHSATRKSGINLTTFSSQQERKLSLTH
ncbi:hypothetical protein AFLA_009076 [Aspergillus flavus NRRL3357]|nr:hypothetical protein AFLA_009076 [Aspergillus flavus NRRL3357]